MRLPDGWTSFRLGDYIGTASGGTPSRKRLDYYNGSIPWVKSGELPDGIIHDCEEFLSPDGLKNSSAKMFAKGTLLIALYGATVGKLGFLTFDAATNQAVCAILPPEEIASRYLFYLLLHRRRELVRAGQGGAQPNISQEIVRDIEIPLPPMDEQRRIVARIDELFSELDAGVASLKRARALLKKYRQALLKAAVTGELTRDWRERHQGEIRKSGAALLQRILKARRAAWEAAELKQLRAKGKPPKDDRWKQKYKEPQPHAAGREPFGLPDTWAWASVDQLATLVQYGTSAKCSENGWAIPVLRMGNIIDGTIDFSELKFLPEDHDEFPELLLQRGDILFNRTNSAELVGKSAVYNGTFKRCSFASYLIRIRVIGIKPEFLTAFINSAFGRAWIGSVVSQQVGQANVNGSKLRALKVPLPPEDEQEEIVQRMDQALTEADAMDSATNAECRRSERARQSILKAAFAGKLVPQDPNDEPASVLLGRICAERAARPRPARARRRTKASTYGQLELLS